jgi:hypothetical protein
MIKTRMESVSHIDTQRYCIVTTISLEEKKRFLEGKLSEEEIGEVMRRYSEAKANPGKAGTSTKDVVLQNVKNSPIAEERL